MVAKGRHSFAMSKRRRRALCLACALALVALVCLDRFGAGGLRRRISQHAQWGMDGWKYHGKAFSVVNVVDGDTLDVDIKDGNYGHTRVRLLGMDTPETRSPKVEPMYYGAQATAYASQLARGREVTLILDTISDVRDMYGRLLAYVRLPDGRILNEELITAGCAYADLRFAHSHYDRYLRLQQKAIEANVGLWREATAEDLPAWLRRERPELLNDE